MFFDDTPPDSGTVIDDTPATSEDKPADNM